MSQIGWEVPEDRAEQKSYEDETELRGRLFFLRLAVVSVLGFLLTYVVWIQQTQGDVLTDEAQANRFAIQTSNAARGVIFDSEGRPLAENIPRFNVTIIPANLPDDDNDRQAVFERLSLLTGVPVTNTVQQQALVEAADSAEVAEAERLADLYGARRQETLDLAEIVEDLPDSIEEIVDTFSFLPFSPAVITSGVPITLARVIDQETVFMPGVDVVPEPIRNYPNGGYTSHIIGFMGPLPDQSYRERGYAPDDRVGLFGLESSMESFLKGEKGQRQIEVDAIGQELRQVGSVTEPTAGYNLHLTIDARLQQQTHLILEDWMERKRNSPSFLKYPEVEQGVVVAMNPKNGEILALVNVPTFDNNRFATEIDVQYYLQLARNDYQPLLNNAIAGQYPPGSVFKLVTGAGALQEGIVTPNRRLNTPGEILIQNRFAPNDPGRSQRFVCWIWNSFFYNEEGELERGEHGALNMYRAVAESCDIYFYKVTGGFSQDGEFVDALDIDRLGPYAREFGFGDTQGIELPAEAPGLIPSREWLSTNLALQWATGDNYNASIGQGYVTTTPLQIAQMAAVVANGGFLYQPTIIDHFSDAENNVVVFDDNDRAIVAKPGADGIPILSDTSGNPIDPATVDVTINFDEEGNYIRPPEILNTVSVDRDNLQVIAEGMRQANDEGGTAGRIGRTIAGEDGPELSPWLDSYGIETAGKTGTAEYCDNIAQRRGWCAQTADQLQPTHAWYVGYAPYDDPEIVVAAFIFNGGEGSAWAGPIAYQVMQAYFDIDSFGVGEPTLER